MGNDTLVSIAKQCADWSFAYLNELRTTAAILSIGHEQASITETDLYDAFDLLSSQFHAGKKNHVVTEQSERLGFKAG